MWRPAGALLLVVSTWLTAVSAGISPLCQLSEGGEARCSGSHARLTLTAGDIPSAATSLLISDVPDLTIASNATRRLPLLRSITVRSLERLLVQPDGLRPPANGSLLSVRLSEVGSVRLRPGAVSGRWPAGATLSVLHVPSLAIEPRGVTGSLAAVSLVNVSLPVVATQALGAGVRRVEVLASRLGPAQPLWYRPRRGRLLFRDTHLAALQPLAVHGSLRQLRVSGGSVGEVSSHAVFGAVRSIRLESCSVASLRTEAIQARVSELVLSRVRVGSAAVRALATARAVSRLRLERVSLAAAAPAALLLNETVRADGLELDRIFLEQLTCPCPLRSAARRLAGADLPSAGAPAAALVHLLMASAYCVEPGRPRVMVPLSAPFCGLPPPTTLLPTSAADLPPAGSDDQTAVFYVVVAGVVALLASLAVLAVRRRHWLAVQLGCAPPGPPPGQGRAGRQPRVSYSTQSSVNSHTHLMSRR